MVDRRLFGDRPLQSHEDGYFFAWPYISHVTCNCENSNELPDQLFLSTRRAWDVKLSGSGINNDVLKQFASDGLAHLTLQGTSVDGDGLNYLAGCPQLENLRVYDSKPLSEALFGHLNRYSKLNWFEFSTSPEYLAALPNSIYSNTVEMLIAYRETDAERENQSEMDHFEWLKGFPNTHRVVLKGDYNCTDSTLAQLAEARPDLTYVVLHGRFTSASFEQIKLFPRLQVLTLGGCEFNGQDLLGLKECPELIFVTFGLLKDIDEAVLDQFADMPYLESIKCDYYRDDKLVSEYERRFERAK